MVAWFLPDTLFFALFCAHHLFFFEFLFSREGGGQELTPASGARSRLVLHGLPSRRSVCAGKSEVLSCVKFGGSLVCVCFTRWGVISC